MNLLTSWTEPDFCRSASTHVAEGQLEDLAATVYERVCRVDFDAPGFCLVNLGTDLDSPEFRRTMVALQRAMVDIHRARRDRDLVVLSAARFDQQVTTKPHRDGGLREYTTRVSCFSNADYQILFVNNSSAPYSAAAPAWQGVLHTATILNPDDAQRRVVDSLMVASAPLGTTAPVSTVELAAFATTQTVRRRGYDKLNLDDDAAI